MLQSASVQMAASTTGTDVLDLATQRMKWLQSRESVLAGNVANANTPGYSARDVPQFQGVLQNHLAVSLTRTDPGHITAASLQSSAAHVAGNTSIDGNQVNVESELEKIASTNDQQRLATNTYSTYMSMFSLALGSSS